MYGIQNKRDKYPKNHFQNNLNNKDQDEKKLREYLNSIHSNINYINNTNVNKENENDLNEISQNTISMITEAYHITTKKQNRNKREILHFLNESSKLCKNILYYNKVKTHKKDFQLMNKMKDVCSHIEENNSDLYKSISNKISNETENNKLNSEKKDEIMKEVQNLSLLIESQSKLYEKLDNKLNCCMQSLACSMELLSYNVEKSKFIHDDLKKNNIITAKISMDNENFNQKLLEFSENNSISDSEISDIQDIKNMLLEAEQNCSSKDNLSSDNNFDKKNDNKSTLVHYLLHTVLKNSKDILCQIIPQMNLWQRQKVFTTIMKLVENRVDNCSDKLNYVINNLNNDKKNYDLSDVMKQIFNTDNLKITKEDIKKATWEESSSDSDSDSDSDSNNKKNKQEILEEIMKELNQEDIKIKKK